VGSQIVFLLRGLLGKVVLVDVVSSLSLSVFITDVYNYWWFIDWCVECAGGDQMYN
jgi:hypothetical protein